MSPRQGRQSGASGADGRGGASGVGGRGGAASRGDEAVFNRLAVLRADRGMSRRELADALGIHYQTMGYLERGEFSPSLHLALRIARYFDVPVESVFSLDGFAPLG